MFEWMDVVDLMKSVEGKTYDKDQVIEFTIKEVKSSTQYKTVSVKCEDGEGDSYTFKFGGEKVSTNKQRLFLSFLTAFFSRDELIAKTANPVTLVGQRFEVKSGGQVVYEGKQYQSWTPTFRKLEAIAAIEEFAG